MTDKTLTCKDCGAKFTFTTQEQEFFSMKGFENEPTRCKNCRIARNVERRKPKEMHSVVCASCGKAAEVPFKPRNDKPVYCDACFSKSR